MNLYELMRKHPDIQLDEEDKRKYGFWCAYINKTTGYVIVNYLNSRKEIHSHIVKAPDGYVIDHEDQDKLNNKRTNLRIITHKQNSWNRKINSSNTSGYTGVTWNKRDKKWRVDVALTVCGIATKHCVGFFDDIHEAAKAYNVAAIRFRGNLATLNKIREVV